MRNALSNVLLGQEHKAAKSELLVYCCAAVSVWIYLILRSISVPLVHDEAVTFHTYMQYATFLPPDAYWDANNHLLNSLFGSISYKLFGFSHWSIRLWNILCFVIYARYVLLIGLTRFHHLMIRWLFFLAMLCTPFAIEFFGLTRGYGGSLAFFLAFLYYVFKSAHNPSNTKEFARVVLFATLSIACNFSIINGVFVVSAWLFIHWLINQETSTSLSLIFKRAFIYILFMIPWVWWILELKHRGLLYYGGSEIVPFFFEPMGLLYLKHQELWWLMILPFCWSFIVILSSLAKYGVAALTKSAFFFSFSSIAGLILIILLQLVIGVNYPEDRAALFFFPFMVGSLLERIPQLKTGLFSPIAVILLWAPLDLVSSMNLTHTRLWRKEHIPLEFYPASQIEQDHGYPLTLSGFRLREVNWQVGNINQPKSSVISSEIFPSSPWTDLILAEKRFEDQLPQSGLDTLITDPASGQFLLKRTSPLYYTSVKDSALSDIETTDEFVNLIDLSGSAIPLEPLRMRVALVAEQHETSIPVILIASTSDTAGTTLYYEKHVLSHHSDQWGNLDTVFVSQVLPQIQVPGGRLVIYLYNPKRASYAFKSVTAKLEIIAEQDKKANN